MARPRKQARSVNGKQAVLYIRVSTKEQAQAGKFGPDAQLSSCMEYCTKHGYSIVGMFSDIGLSGTLDTLDRPGIAQAMDMCKSRQADVIVSAAQDRLARDSGIFDDIRSHARKFGYRLEPVKESMDMAAEENEITGDALVFVASIERKNIVKRTLGGRRERAKVDGRSSSYLPFGYRLERVQDVIAIDDEQAKVVRFILSEREQESTYQAIADSLRYNSDLKPNGQTDWNVGNVQTIESRKSLYTTGVRTWDGINASEKWPIIYAPRIAV